MLRIVIGRVWEKIKREAQRDVIKEEVRVKEVKRRVEVRLIGRWRAEARKGIRDREVAQK